MGGAGVSLESEYQTILNRGTALGYTLPSGAQQLKQNTFLKYLKDNGIWTALDRLWVFATDGSSSFSLIDWKNPSGSLALAVSSPTFNSNIGWTGDGVASYLRTQFTPSTQGVNYVLNNACAFYAGKIGTSFKAGFGSQEVANTNGVYIVGNGGADPIRINGAQIALSFVPTDTQTFAYIDRQDATNLRHSLDGAAPTTVANASTALPSKEIFIGAYNSTGSATFFNNQPCNMVGFGASVNPATLYTGWNAYFTSL